VGEVSSRTPSGQLGAACLCCWILKKGNTKDIDHCLKAGDDGLVKISHLAAESADYPLVYTVPSAVKIHIEVS